MALLAAALVAGGCESKGTAQPPGNTVPTEAPASTTTTVDVASVPEEITVAYLDAVVDRLDVVVGDAFRELVRDRGPNKRFLDLLNAVYDGQEFEDKQSVYGRIAARDFENTRTDPGNPVTTVEHIIKNEPGCVIVAANRTFAAFFKDPKEASTKGYLAFVPKAADSDPGGLNPTAWSLVFDGATLDDVEPVTAC
ncbi:MAG: hypothetical protein KY439_00445 [Actinobacteria bacterium]|nr:hypothetical protein [Actinomycetota bacterium]